MKPSSEVFKTFGQQASVYDAVAWVQHEIGSRLFERLDYLKMKPRVVLDLGCGTGRLTQQLQTYYPDAYVIGLDYVASMLNQARLRLAESGLLQADILKLPFADGCIDLVLSNQVVHWASCLQTCFMEIQRVLRPEGCFMFSTLGPDTFRELQRAFAQVDNHAHVHPFKDMHDVGDLLLAQHFVDPVMDREDLTAHYPDLKRLLQGLKAQGIRNLNPHRPAGLMGRQAFAKFEVAYETYLTPEGKAPLTYEVLYGQAWKGKVHMGSMGAETWIPLKSCI